MLHMPEQISEIDDAAFFLSPEGKTDAQSELEATIRALINEERLTEETSALQTATASFKKETSASQTATASFEEETSASQTATASFEEETSASQTATASF
ncbi:MAG: hypothetical protein IBX43_01570, partial [Campylobacterales bacterium]|nr:hypothetical protein [Campylobacterales bacterium]